MQAGTLSFAEELGATADDNIDPSITSPVYITGGVFDVTENVSILASAAISPNYPGTTGTLNISSGSVNVSSSGLLTVNGLFSISDGNVNISDTGMIVASGGLNISSMGNVIVADTGSLSADTFELTAGDINVSSDSSFTVTDTYTHTGGTTDARCYVGKWYVANRNLNC